MPRGGLRTPGPGKKLGRPPKSLASITHMDVIKVLRAPRGIDKLFDVRLKKYGLTRVEYEAMLNEQRGRCALCDEPLGSGWVIDHCHITMRVRGLLHTKCNTLLGDANEDPKRLELAIAYLKRHNKFLN